ncbi:YihY/virulence factor BrkB family protein [Formosa algae]|uniref:Membrane protein n=1 Tax=Formosa algae TaxID=225843 RepID=A0A9X0YJ41_9FLAO|nr:YihY/virulence factor BrkB family protein [Formosa algae]MBP1839441.1 membrane protein [Formosa algae]MDQ0334745.1 membrane protein [Formosa algae]OEI81996.1 ribonuclease BN [Formosa algae]
MSHVFESKLKLKDVPYLFKETFNRWLESDPWRLSAIIAYYSILSLPGLLVIIINVIGSIWGTEIVEGELTKQISDILGGDTATSIQTMIAETQNSKNNIWSTIVSIATLLFGATGVFYQLQISLNDVWDIEMKPGSNFRHILLSRVRSFAFILVVGFLLLVSLMVSASISILNTYIQKIFPDAVLYAAYVIDLGLSLAIISALFSLMFKYLPNAKIPWKSVWIGGFLTAVLFVIGQSLLGYYFSKADPASTYGAAGTVVLILLWVSYSCLILFFGAQFTWVYAKHYTIDITPTAHARLKSEN